MLLTANNPAQNSTEAMDVVHVTCKQTFEITLYHLYSDDCSGNWYAELPRVAKPLNNSITNK